MTDNSVAVVVVAIIQCFWFQCVVLLMDWIHSEEALVLLWHFHECRSHPLLSLLWWTTKHWGNCLFCFFFGDFRNFFFTTECQCVGERDGESEREILVKCLRPMRLNWSRQNDATLSAHLKWALDSMWKLDLRLESLAFEMKLNHKLSIFPST